MQRHSFFEGRAQLVQVTETHCPMCFARGVVVQEKGAKLSQYLRLELNIRLCTQKLLLTNTMAFSLLHELLCQMQESFQQDMSLSCVGKEFTFFLKRNLKSVLVKSHHHFTR